MDRAQLIKVLGMLGSNGDGEVLNAARKALEILTKANLTWADVITGDGDGVRALLIEVDTQIKHLSPEDRKSFSVAREHYFGKGSLDDGDVRRIRYFKDLIEASRGDDDIPF